MINGNNSPTTGLFNTDGDRYFSPEKGLFCLMGAPLQMIHV